MMRILLLQEKQSFFIRSVIAVFVAAAAFIFRELLTDYTAIPYPPWFTFYPAVMLTALLLGMWAGILSTFISALLSIYFILPPIGYFFVEDPSDITRVSLFAFMGLSMSIVAGLNIRYRQKAADYQKELALEQERKRAEDALMESEKRFSRAFYASPAPTVITTLVEGCFIDVNESWLKAMGYTREDVIRNTTYDLAIIDPETREPIISKLIEKGYLRDESVEFRTKSGEVRNFLWSAELIDFGGRQVVLSLFHDLTERKKMEEALQKANEELESKVRERTSQLLEINRSLAAEVKQRKLSQKNLLSAQENLRAMASEILQTEERSRQLFATDLHDTVVQTLGAAKLRAQIIEDQIPQQAKPLFSELQDMLSHSIKQARSIMVEMSPPVLYELGFVPALEWLTEQMERQRGIKVVFENKDGSSTVPLSHEVQVLLFQATRELLVNVVKHSGAEKAVVRLSGESKKVRIEVVDNGIGFDMCRAFRTDQKSGGFGLFSIRERLRHIGGQLVVRSSPGKGTHVIMSAPPENVKVGATG